VKQFITIWGLPLLAFGLSSVQSMCIFYLLRQRLALQLLLAALYRHCRTSNPPPQAVLVRLRTLGVPIEDEAKEVARVR
jgi:hypothetical protein